MAENTGPLTTFLKVFWALVFVSIAISIGGGPPSLDIARISIVGMVVVFYLATRIGSKNLLIHGEGLCLATFLITGAISQNGYLIAMGIFIMLFWLIIILCIYVRKKYKLSSF